MCLVVIVLLFTAPTECPMCPEPVTCPTPMSCPEPVTCPTPVTCPEPETLPSKVHIIIS